MAHLPLIPPQDATGVLKDLYESAQRRAGYIAQIIQVMSNDGNSAKASMRFYVTLMQSENGLSKTRKEMLASVVSHANDCYY